MVRHGSTEYASVSQGREENWKHLMKTKLTRDPDGLSIVVVLRRSIDAANV
jgi:hypothetical protein